MSSVLESLTYNPVLRTRINLFQTPTLPNIVDEVPLYYYLYVTLQTQNDKIEAARKYLYKGDKAGYDRIKTNSTAVRFNSIFKSNDEVALGLSGEAIDRYTKLVYFDLDQKDHSIPLSSIKEQLVKSFPYLIASWSSYSGEGVGFIAYCEDITDEISLKQAFSEIKKEILLQYPYLVFDSIDSGVRCNYVSHDTYPKINLYPVSYKIKGERLPDNKHVKPHLPTSEDNVGAKFYSQTFVDIHENAKSEFTDQQSKNRAFDKGSFIISIDGISRTILYSKPKIEDNGRNVELYKWFIRYVGLNGHVKNHDQLKSGLIRENNNKCSNPLSEKDINKIFHSVLKTYDEGKLYMPSRKVNTAWKSTCTFSKEEKCSISSHNKMIINVYNFIDRFNALHLKKEILQKITKKQLGKLTKIPVRTLDRYIPFILEQGANLDIRCNILEEGCLHRLSCFAPSKSVQIEQFIENTIKENKDILSQSFVSKQKNVSLRKVKADWSKFKDRITLYNNSLKSRNSEFKQDRSQ